VELRGGGGDACSIFVKDAVVTTFAGGVNFTVDGTGTNAGFGFFQNVAVDASGNIFVAESVSIRKVTAGGGTCIGPVAPHARVALG
jgi:hypothetical protein